MFRLVLGLFVAASAFGAPTVKVTTLLQLDRFEPFEAHLFHSGHLFTGRSRKNIYADYHLYAYDPSGKLVAETALEHSARYIYPYGDDRVLVVGISAEPNISRYSIVTLEKGKLTVARHDIPESALADQAAVDAKGKLYFTDPGGMQEDGLDLSKAARTVFTLEGGEPRWLQARIHGPSRPKVLGNVLYVLENLSLGSGAAAIARVNLKTEQVSYELPKGDHALGNLVYLPEHKLLVATDVKKKTLVVINPRADVAPRTVTLPEGTGTPHGVTELGRCLVVAGQETKTVSFLDASTGKELSRWDLSAAGASLYGIRSIAVDPKTGNLFARSAYAANPAAPGPEERNGVVLAVDASGETLKACGAGR